ncbi:hypothetical protein WUBG_09592, partial [Wuchereria bancrofti]
HLIVRADIYHSYTLITYHISSNNNNMACWIVTLQGGPKRPTQTAVAISDKIYAFGSCWCVEPNETFGVHVLNTSLFLGF